MSGQFDVISGIPSSLCWLIRAYLIDLSIFKNMSGSRPAGHTSMHYAGKALENEINVNLCWKRGDRMIYINCCKSCFICTLAVLLRQTHECLCANHLWNENFVKYCFCCKKTFPANSYLFKVNNRNTKKGVKYVQSLQ